MPTVQTNISPLTMLRQSLEDPSRARAAYDVLELSTTQHPALKRLAKMGSQVMSAPFCCISIIDPEFNTFRLVHNLDHNLEEVPLSLEIEESLCQYTLCGDFVAINDIREFNSPAALSIFSMWGFQSYLGTPIKVDGGAVIGALCILDYRPREWTQKERDLLSEFGSSVETEINYQVCLDRIAHENESRDRVISMLAHDLRTPLNIIQNNAELVLLEECDTSLMKDCAASILRSCDQSTHLIENFLDWKLSTLGPSDKIGKDSFDVVAMARNCIFDFTKIHGEIFRLSFNARPIVGEYNQYAIKRSMDNLINNAIKYGDISRPISLIVNKTAEGMLEISVHNYGNPLTEEEIKHIFNPYYRSNDARKKKAKGWGLGLALVSAVALAHSGRAEATSSEDEGTSFKIILPLGENHQKLH